MDDPTWVRRLQRRVRHLGSVKHAPRRLVSGARTHAAEVIPFLRTPSRHRRVRVRAAALLAALAVLSPMVLTEAHDVRAVPVHAVTNARHQPNIVVILTDDQRTDTLLDMPTVRRLLVDQGTRFTHQFVSNSLCCPSRSTILTGLYAHDTGVWENGGVYGGWHTFRKHGLEQHTIAVALQQAGYHTGLVGKYLNEFGKLAPTPYDPPGWNEFDAFRVQDHSGAYYNYKLGDSPTWYGTSSADYSTNVLTSKAVNFIWSSPAKKPLFLYYAPYAPHLPAIPAPGDVGSLAGKLPLFRPPSVTENAVDKPVWVKRRPITSQQEINSVRERTRESLIAVDNGVGAIMAALQHSGRLNDTMILFTSDNGYLDGQHRIVGKSVPYNDAISVPLVIRWDGHVPAGGIDDNLASNVDFAATIAAAAGVSMKTDGTSLLVNKPRRSGQVLEAIESPHLYRPPYCGWRTKSWMYVHYGTGEEELYSYRNDPYELNNLAINPDYARKLSAMKAQAKQACQPMPPGFSWG